MRRERWKEEYEMSDGEIKDLVSQTVSKAASEGPGYAQEGVALRSSGNSWV